MGILIDSVPLNIFLFAADIERHHGRIVYLTYEPSSGSVDKTLYLVGKGVTYDTGGADIKAGGVMAGMSRDKCGAAAVAGFMQVYTYQRCDLPVIRIRPIISSGYPSFLPGKC